MDLRQELKRQSKRDWIYILIFGTVLLIYLYAPSLFGQGLASLIGDIPFYSIVVESIELAGNGAFRNTGLFENIAQVFHGKPIAVDAMKLLLVCSVWPFLKAALEHFSYKQPDKKRLLEHVNFFLMATVVKMLVVICSSVLLARLADAVANYFGPKDAPRYLALLAMLVISVFCSLLYSRGMEWVVFKWALELIQSIATVVVCVSAYYSNIANSALATTMLWVSLTVMTVLLFLPKIFEKPYKKK